MRMAGEGFGIGKYTTELASALIKRGSFEYVLFFDKTFSAKAYENFKRLGVECYLVSARYYSFEEQIKLPSGLRKFKLDLVHFLNFNVPIFYGGKYVVTIHDLIHHRFPGTSIRTLIWRMGYRIAINRAVSRSRQVIAVSEASKNDIISMLGVSREKVTVVHEAVDASFLTSAQNKPGEVLTRYNISKPYIIWVGVWRRYKNLEILARSFNTLVKSGFDFQLVLAGEEDIHHPEVAAKIREIVSNERLIAPGRVSQNDLVSLYAGAEVFVNPSLTEGFGLTSVEAQTLGLPVVASDIPVMREVLGESALYFSPSSEEQLLSRLSVILGDKSVREKYAKKSLENARRYSWEETAKKTEKIYGQILNTKF